MSNVIVDSRMIKSSGIGTYIFNLNKEIFEIPNNYKFHLLLNEDEEIHEKREKYKFIKFNAPIYSINEQYELLKLIKFNTDIFWSPHYNIPLFYKGKLLVTIHDVFHLAMPQYVKGLHKKMYAKFMFNAVKKKANKIICVSNFTKNELIRLVGVDEKKIKVIHNGVDKSWFDIIKKDSPHNRPYLLYVGNVKPHKNLNNLLNAFDLIKDCIPHDVIIVGKKEGFITGDKKLFDKALKFGDRVHFTGFVEEEILKQYYVHADALVFPSFYEGFGLPPLEAMAVGCPVIVSNAASLPEVCGDAALYCDPYSPKDIADKIKLLIANPSLQEELRQKGLERAKLFTWEKCAKETMAVIEEVLNQ